MRALIALGLPTAGRWPAYHYPFLPELQRPKLFLSGDSDAVRSARRELAQVVASAAEPKRLVLLPGADHFFTGQLEADAAGHRRLVEGATAMTPASETALETLHDHGDCDLHRRA